MAKTKKINIGVKGVIVKDNKVLLLKRNLGNRQVYWDVSGGRVDDNEDLLETLRRELVEEIPSIVNFEIKEILDVYRLPRGIEKDLGLILLFYRVQSDITNITLSHEHFEYRWFNQEELEDIHVGMNTEVDYIEDGYKQACLKSLSI